MIHKHVEKYLDKNVLDVDVPVTHYVWLIQAVVYWDNLKP